ncbi:hypothetical protein C8A00DRAFT_30952 [Chaetomidium leptoderma]|uniref:Uncharacterized protein n=1 Tax=Chaetomidium leptoderma TaxID=669021 RepID=A0AAN7A0V9_9PEZI|nr:hypothetical protein C8A00DRAFT_30952 [Chaetomidium leptoderma]
MRVLGSVIEYVFELSRAVSWQEVGHKRLADLLISLKESAPPQPKPPTRLAWLGRPNPRLARKRLLAVFYPKTPTPQSKTAPPPSTSTSSSPASSQVNLCPSSSSGWRTAAYISQGLQEARPLGRDNNTKAALLRRGEWMAWARRLKVLAEEEGAR